MGQKNPYFIGWLERAKEITDGQNTQYKHKRMVAVGYHFSWLFFSELEQQEPGSQKKNHYSLGRKNPPTHIVLSSVTEKGRLRMPGPGLEKNT